MISEYILPFQPSIPSYDFTTTIEGRSLIFLPRWNEREVAWFLDITEIDQTPIISGAKLVLGAFIGRESTHIMFRRGVLVCVDTTGNQQEAGYDDMGVRVLVKYIPGLDLLRRLTTANIQVLVAQQSSS